MGSAQVLAEHHDKEELYHLYRSASDPVERLHWQIIYLKKTGYSTRQLSEVSAYMPNWVRVLVRRYNKEGAAGLRDRRREHPGAPGLLTEEDEQALRAALDGPAPDGTPWNGPKGAAWMAEGLGRKVHPQRGGERLIRSGLQPTYPSRVYSQDAAAASPAGLFRRAGGF